MIKRLIASVCAVAALGLSAATVSVANADTASPQACGLCWPTR